jgi:hypothetical protein
VVETEDDWNAEHALEPLRDKQVAMAAGGADKRASKMPRVLTRGRLPPSRRCAVNVSASAGRFSEVVESIAASLPSMVSKQNPVGGGVTVVLCSWSAAVCIMAHRPGERRSSGEQQ